MFTFYILFNFQHLTNIDYGVIILQTNEKY